MPTKLSLVGRTFGKWKVLRDGPPRILPCGRYQRTCVVACECGTISTVLNSSLTGGKSRQCRICRNAASVRHGLHGTLIYQRWAAMIDRCENPDRNGFHNYGGRGVRVCAKWRESFVDFLHDMGDCPKGLTIERIDNNRGYEPGNCKWATRKEQGRNRRSNTVVTVRGFTGCLKAACEHFGISYDRVRRRLKDGWSIERAFFGL